MSDFMCYRLLTAILIILPKASKIGNYVHFRSIAERSLRMLFISSGRVRHLTAKILLQTLLLGHEAINDLQLDYHRDEKRINSGTIGGPPRSILTVSQIFGHSDFKSSFTLYIIRLIGCCWDPSLLANNSSYFKLNKSRIWGEYFINKELSDFIMYTPEFIGRAIYNSTFPTNNNADPDEASSVKIKEFASMLTELLRDLSSSVCWKSTIAEALETVLVASTASLSSRDGWKGFHLIESLGATAVLGARSNCVLLGKQAHSAYGRNRGSLISISAATGQATMLCADQKQGGIELITHQLPEFQFTSLDETIIPYRRGTTIACCEIAVALLPFTRISCSDLTCLKHLDSAFIRTTLMHCFRPTEMLMLSFCLNHLAIAPQAHFFDDTTQMMLVNLSSLSVRVKERFSRTEVDLWQLWARCSAFCALSLGPVMESSFPLPHTERLCYEFISHSLNMHNEGLREFRQNDMLNTGYFVELVYMTSTSSNAFAMPLMLINSGVRRDLDSDDLDVGVVLDLNHYLRSSIIETSRRLLVKTVVMGGHVFMEPHYRVLAYDVMAEMITEKSSKIEHDARHSMELLTSNTLEIGASMSTRLRYTALSLLKPMGSSLSPGLLDGTDIFSRQVYGACSWIECVWIGNTDLNNLIGILRVLLPTLSFAKNSSVEKYLLQVSVIAAKGITAKIFKGWAVPKELFELCKVRAQRLFFSHILFLSLGKRISADPGEGARATCRGKRQASARSV